MNALNHDHIVRFLTAFRRGEPGNEDHYLMFEWADGGNLRTLWEKALSQPLTPNLLKAAVREIWGIADGLDKAHNPKSGPRFRHGDLKPENILWFKGDDEIGTLKIADWGLAKGYNEKTELRNSRTTGQQGTRMYEPPEEDTGEGISLPAVNSWLGLGATQTGRVKSRVYDVWSLGCIIMEFIIWLLYGEQGRKTFVRELRGHSEVTLFYQSTTHNSKKVAKVHEVVVKWMDQMWQDARCQPGQTALGDLLQLVQKRLLVVRIHLADKASPAFTSRRPTNSSTISDASLTVEMSSPVSGLAVSRLLETSGPEIFVHRPEMSLEPGSLAEGDDTIASKTEYERPLQYRALSHEVSSRILEIQEQNNDTYWATEVQEPTESATETSNGYEVNTIQPVNLPIRELVSGHSGTATSLLPIPRTERVDYGSNLLGTEWDICIDNPFAAKLFNKVENSGPLNSLPPTKPTINLCPRCQELRHLLWNPGFSIIYSLARVERASLDHSCSLCALLWRAFSRRRVKSSQIPDTLLLQREGSRLKINSSSDLSFSIFRSPNLDTRASQEVQIGYTSALPAPGSALHFSHINHWLATCDKHHPDCKPGTNSSSLTQTLPTRLVDVGSVDSPMARLIETSTLSSTTQTPKWVALSHQWGPPPHFCTTVENLSTHLSSIPLGSGLADTFRDAFLVTRALGIRYLWIDSLCIVQGPGGDFAAEAKKMEQVYSGAYCVLAVSREKGGHSTGFLKPRARERDHVVLSKPGDDDGKQGVFSICESIDNFNGDVLKGPLNQRGWVLQEHALARRTIFFTENQTYFECGQGVMCQSMMRMKNNLAAFLGDPNFPNLISKVPRARRYNVIKTYRILSALGAKGGFGVFDEGPNKKGLLRRSLLWVRSRDTEKMVRIKFGSEQAISFVPSWSWMGYEGGIEYISPPFGEIQWYDLTSPWFDESQSLSLISNGRGPHHQGSLLAEAVDYDISRAGEEERRIEMDSWGGSERTETKCVVLGSTRGLSLEEGVCYVILIRAAGRTGGTNGGEEVYERVGAGSMPGRCIIGNPVRVIIQ
ncbi:hypothetical protein QBC41DRAFT_399065 [Cercophora samala]|uniref:Protein kinase domain-containing protein n=1 Tax=Cercophora samala TaxID=330535 RepID=A0AA40DA72_9PEZI|nr:hypothetical protein QBC41DRAFT_399065 [Cercophora samala]